MKLSQLLLAGLGLFASLNSTRAADLPLVHHSDLWRYHKGTNAPQSAWQTIPEGALDSSWGSASGGFGYGDAGIVGQATTLSDMTNRYTTLFIRKSFDIVSDVDTNLHLQLTIDYDDGYVAYLDGGELNRARAPGAPGTTVLFNTNATANHEASCCNAPTNPPSVLDFGAVGNRLAVGTHVLAIQGLNVTSNSSDFHLIADLSLVAYTAPTNGVSGTLAADTRWYTINSPYLVVGDLTVASAATLTIEPGVDVLFNQGLGITVDGRLVAEGTDTNPIRFSRTAGATAWGGLTINGYDGSPETRIRYAHFEFNGSVPIHSAGGTVFLDHLTFGTTDHQYLSLDGSSFVVSESVFPSATAAYEMLHGTGGIKPGGHGIFIRNFFGVPIGYSDVIDFTGGNRPAPILQVINNVFTGTTDDILDLDGTDAWVEGNIFLHSHKNGAPDSSAAVSGGSSGGNTSEVTIMGNLFFDCDQAATAKQGNFYTFINNTIVHTTKTGGLDTASGVVNVRDLDPSPTTFGDGFYLEGNIIVDAEELVRNYDAAQTTVTFNNNILPSAWSGPGTGNLIADPLLKHVPQLAETVFTNWSQAQIMRDWFSLSPASPAVGTGPNGRDMGGVIPLGTSVSGEPSGTTTDTGASLTVGALRTGSGIPSAGWPDGSGYTQYKWRLDDGPWSAETPIGELITLSGLADGPHFVEVVGRRDSGFYQDDPVFGANAVITRSRTWTVQTRPPFMVGGTLSSNATWTPALGQIFVLSDVVVPTNVTLTISSGTVVGLTNGVSVIAAAGGTIRLLGAATNKVRFVRLNGTNNWGQLGARGTNAALTIRFADISGGQTSVFTNATAICEDSYFHDYRVFANPDLYNQPIMITERAGPVTLRRCRFREYHETLFRYGLTTIEDSLFENIHGDGVDFDYAVPGSVIRRCTFRHGDGSNIDAVDIGSFSTGVGIEQCLMYDFPFDKGVSIGEHAQDITVRNCLIYGVDSGVAVKDSSVANIYNNTIVASNYGLNLYEKIAGEGGGHATAWNNILWGNTTSISLANGSTISATYSDISGTDVYPGTNNFNADPLFLDPVQRDYRLATNSPARDMGAGGTNLGPLFAVGSLLLDTDGDGLPDPWEWEFGLDFNSAADADLDPDGDGLTNRQEYVCGTNPRDPLSSLKFDAIVADADAVRLRFTAAADKSYTLQYRSGAAEGAWEKRADVPPAATNRAVEWLDTDAHLSGVGFYRLVTPAQP